MQVAVLGAGSMGHGITQVSAQASHDVFLRDVESSIVNDGLDEIHSNLQGAVDRDIITSEERDATLDRITETTDLVGLDVRLHIAEHLRKKLGERFRPPLLLRRKVRGTS